MAPACSASLCIAVTAPVSAVRSFGCRRGAACTYLPRCLLMTSAGGGGANMPVGHRRIGGSVERVDMAIDIEDLHQGRSVVGWCRRRAVHDHPAARGGKVVALLVEEGGEGG